MHFSTLILTTFMLALVNASPAMMRRYGNDTIMETPTFASTDSVDIETMPTTMPSNSTIESSDLITSSEVEQLITSVESMTITYTLGPKGSSSVIITVVESTTTITMHSTMYVTITLTDDENTLVPEPTPTGLDDGSSVKPTATDHGYNIPSTPEPTVNFSDDGSVPPDATGASPDGGDGHVTRLTMDGPSDATSKPTDGKFFPTPESTVTITNYLTTTMYITLEPVETGTSVDAVPHDGADPGNGFEPGVDLGSGACGVTTITATIVEQSTVTVTPTETNTDNFSILSTATPSFGYGNGTEPTGYATASSSLFSMLKRTIPTKP